MKKVVIKIENLIETFLLNASHSIHISDIVDYISNQLSDEEKKSFPDWERYVIRVVNCGVFSDYANFIVDSDFRKKIDEIIEEYFMENISRERDISLLDYVRDEMGGMDIEKWEDYIREKEEDYMGSLNY